jgi:hypothetical protein
MNCDEDEIVSLQCPNHREYPRKCCDRREDEDMLQRSGLKSRYHSGAGKITTNSHRRSSLLAWLTKTVCIMRIFSLDVPVLLVWRIINETHS